MAVQEMPTATGGDNQSVLDVNTEIGAAVGDIVRTTLGPTGMEKVLMDTNGMALITGDTKTILGEMGMNLDLLPAPRLLKELAVDIDAEQGDGAGTAVVLAAELLREASELVDRGLHPTTVGAGYELAARRATDTLTDMSHALSLDDPDHLHAVVQTAIGGTSNGHDDVLTSLVVDAASALYSTGPVSYDRVSVRKVTGGTVAESMLTHGVVFEGEPVHVEMPRRVEPARVACLDTDVMPEETRTDVGKIDLWADDGVDSLSRFEEGTVEEKAMDLCRCGANVVFSDASIDEPAQQVLADRGILAVRRMSSENLERVARATDATITETSMVEPTDLGWAETIEHTTVGGDGVMNVVAKEPKHVSLVLRGGTEQVLDEMGRGVRTGFGAVESLHEDPRVVPGGGAVETSVTAGLRRYSSQVAGREQLAIEAFADAVDALPKALAENAGLDPKDALVELRRRHADGETDLGVDAVSHRLSNVTDAGIVDPLAVKRRAIQSAANIVSRVVRIDDVLVTEADEDIEPEL